MDGKVYGYWRKLLEFSCLIDLWAPFFHIPGHWIQKLLVWNRCLGLRNTLKNLRGVDRTTKNGETELFLASRPLKKPVDPNEEV